MNKILILGVMLMFGMSLVLASPTNLAMSDLEDMSLDGLTVTDYSDSEQDACFHDGENWVNIIFSAKTYEGAELGGGWYFLENEILLGENYMGHNVVYGYVDEGVSDELPTMLLITTDCNIDIREGDYITFTYDVGQSLDVYLPIMSGPVFDQFFIASDGSTYYDPDLTELAMARPVIMGPTIVELGSTNTYNILMTTTEPDSDYSDGTYQIQYANWGLMDSNGNLIQEGIWEEVFGEYQETTTITFSNEVGEYSLFAMITQIDLVFDEVTGQWTSGEEYILTQEAIKINVQYSVTEPDAPNPGGFSFFSDIWDWLSNLWGWLF